MRNDKRTDVYLLAFFFCVCVVVSKESYLPDPPFSLSSLPRYASHLRARRKMSEPQITSMNLFLLLPIRCLQTFLRLDKYKEAEMHTLVLMLFQ